MAPPTWTAPQQREFLNQKKPAYLQSQTSGRLKHFFATVNEEWFQEWPVRESLFPTPEGQVSVPLTAAQCLEVKKAVEAKKEVSLGDGSVINQY